MKTRHGNPIIRKILIQAAQGATHKKGTFYHAKYCRLRYRLGSANKAKVAIANRIARAIYHIIKHKEVCYHDIGPKRAHTDDKEITRTLNKLKSLGVEVKFHYHQNIVEAKKEITVEV